MPTNTHPAGKTTTLPSTSTHTRNTATLHSTSTHTRNTATLHIAGHQLPAVRTHAGTVRAETTATAYGVRTLSVTLARTVLVYCTNRAVVDAIATLWEHACHNLTALPPVTPQAVTATLHPLTDAGATATTALTFTDVPGLHHQPHGGTSTRRTAIAVTMGPLVVIVYDRRALVDVRDAWSYAREAAERHWAQERIRSDWDHIT